MMLPTLDLARPRTFRRYLAHAQRRHRRGNGSGSAYILTVFGLFYASTVLLWAWLTLSGPPPSHTLLAEPAAALMLVAGLLTLGAGCSFLGPIPASQAWVAWVLSTPVDRRVLLAGRTCTRLILASLPGATLAAVSAVAAGLRDSSALAILMTGGAGGVIVCGAAILSQRRETRPAGWWRWGAVAVLVLSAVILQLFFTRLLFQSWWWWSAGIATVVGALAFGPLAVRSVGQIPLHRLTAADTVRVAMTSAFGEQSMERLSTVNAVVRWRAKHAYRPLTGTGQAALAAVCRRLFLRTRIGLLRFAVAAAVPSLLVALSYGTPPAPALVDVFSLVAATLAISPAAAPARQIYLNTRLQSLFGIDAEDSRRAIITIPAVIAGLWGLFAAPALLVGGPVVMVVLIPVLAYLVVVYRLTRPEYVPSYTMGQQYQTDLVMYFFRGPAQLVLACCVVAYLARTHVQ